jgi:hypothetical protein
LGCDDIAQTYVTIRRSNRWCRRRSPAGRAARRTAEAAGGLTTLALAGLGALAPDASQGVEVVVLVVANLAATLLRYFLLRLWVFGLGATPEARADELQGLAACPTPRPRPRTSGRRTTTHPTHRA